MSLGTRLAACNFKAHFNLVNKHIFCLIQHYKLNNHLNIRTALNIMVTGEEDTNVSSASKIMILLKLGP